MIGARARRAAFILCLLLGAVALWPVGAAGKLSDRGTWSPAANLLTGRTGHTATLLNDSRVLVAGGSDGGLSRHGLASGELFDPKTNRWAPAASMSTPRVEHTATLLPNGQVLVAGGRTSVESPEALASAEIYDPGINRWLPGPPMHAARARHTATLLKNGKVLVVGGIAVAFNPYRLAPVVAELYDPSTSGWTILPNGQAIAREQHTATLLPSGKVMVIGGVSELSCPDPSTELYDPVKNAWDFGPGVTGRFGHTATLLPGGKILVLGGIGAQGCTVEHPTAQDTLASGELYDPKPDIWSSIAVMQFPRAKHTSTLLPNGGVLVVGTDAASNARPELYDIAIDSWLVAGPPMGRYAGHTATLLRDGRVLIAGGYGISPPSTAFLYSSGPPESPAGTNGGVSTVIALGLVGIAAAAIAARLSYAAVVTRLRGWWASRRSGDWTLR